jgi:hypothetical protein
MATMNRIQAPPLTEVHLAELEELYQKIKASRLRTRAQMVLQSAEQGYNPHFASVGRHFGEFRVS